MRYADGPTAEASVDVAAPAVRVWELVADIELPTRFSDELIAARWLDDRRGRGARFVGRSSHPAAGEWETTCTVTELEPLRRFAWVVGDPEFPSAEWRFDLEPLDDTHTRVTQWARLGPAPSGLTPAIEAMPDKEERIVARRLEEHRANMQSTVEGIKGMAEGGA
jgi:hypothetical protein